MLYVEGTYTATLELRDVHGNACDRSSATVQARLTYVKQGVHDATVLNAYNHSVSVEDHSDGTYAVVMQLFKLTHMPQFTVNLVVTLDRDPKEKPNGTELTPIHLTFLTPPKAATPADGAPAPAPNEKSPPNNRSGRQLMKKAVHSTQALLRVARDWSERSDGLLPADTPSPGCDPTASQASQGSMGAAGDSSRGSPAESNRTDRTATSRTVSGGSPVRHTQSDKSMLSKISDLTS